MLAASCSDVKRDPSGGAVVTRLHQVEVTGAGYSISAFGQFRYRRQIEFGFLSPGLLTNVVPDAGEEVPQGAVIARIEPTLSQASMRAAMAREQSAASQLARFRALQRQGWVSKAQYEVVEAQAKQAHEEVAAARFERSQSIMRASSDIVILSRNAEPGQVVAPGQSVLTAGDARQGIVFVASLPAGDIRQLRLGDAARITIPGESGGLLSGQVVEIAGQADPRTGLFEVKVRLAQTGIAAPGQSGRVEFDPAVRSQAVSIIVPSQAVFDIRAGVGFVYRLDPQTSRLRVRRVQLGAPLPNGIAVSEGLAPGDRIAVANLTNLHDGQFVNRNGQPEIGRK
ncbi:MAG: efflux RND transporter periplasmic adaptor subunit [Novosphingobium sp.]